MRKLFDCKLHTLTYAVTLEDFLFKLYTTYLLLLIMTNFIVQ